MPSDDTDEGPTAEYEYTIDVEGDVLAMTPYRRGVNAFLRWEYAGDEGRRGGVTADGLFVADAERYVRDEDVATLPLPEALHEDVLSDLERLRSEGVEEQLSSEEAEAFEQDKRVFERAREILEAGDRPTVDETEAHTIEVELGDRMKEVTLRAVEHEGLAEVRVQVDDLEGYSPRYELGERILTLPAMGTWRFTQQIEVPAATADALLDDLTRLQEQLNARREAYDDAVERARDEIIGE